MIKVWIESFIIIGSITIGLLLSQFLGWWCLFVFGYLAKFLIDVFEEGM